MPSTRHRNLLYLLLAAWVAISLSYYVAGIAAMYQRWVNSSEHVQEPFDTGIDESLENVSKEAQAAGLANGDKLELLNGKAFTGDAQLTDLFNHGRPGDRIKLGVRKSGGQVRTVVLRLKPHETPGASWSIFAYVLTMLVVPLLSLLVGYWVVLARPADLNAWLILLILTAPECFFGDIRAVWWPGVPLVVFSMWAFFVPSFSFPALLWFGLLFPERSRVDRRFPWIKLLALAVAVPSFILLLWAGYIQAFVAAQAHQYSFINAWNGHSVDYLAAFCTALFLVPIFDQFRTASNPDARRRVRVLAIGSAISLGPLLVIFGLLPRFGIESHHGKWFLLGVPFLVIFPLTLAYVLVIQRAMDIRVLVRMGTRYLLARVTLAVLEFGVAAILIIGFLIPALARKQNQTLDWILIGLIVTAVLRLYAARDSISHRLQTWLDRKFFREAYNAEVILSELSEHARRFTDKSLLIETVSRQISEVLHVRQVAVWLRNGEVFQLQQAFGLNLTGPVLLSEASAPVLNLVRVNKPATVYRDRPDEWLVETGPDERLILDQVHAELLLPLPGRDRLLGVMSLGSKLSEEPYTSTDLRVLAAVATQTGLALEVNELAQSLASAAAQQARADREIEIAHEVQERLFPQTIPAIQGLTLAGHCRPALGVGGDYYDMIPLDDGRLGLAIGDVSGKGVPAALLMASLRASLRTMTSLGLNDLAFLMRKMNQLVYESSAVHRYATFFFAIYDPATRELRYVNAGHNPPFLIRADPQDVSSPVHLDAGGLVVGLMPDVQYEEQSVTVQSGDLLLAYTDGISEAMTADEEEWGEERMMASVNGTRQDSANQILRAIFNAADAFTKKAPQHDDMTLLIVKHD